MHCACSARIYRNWMAKKTQRCAVLCSALMCMHLVHKSCENIWNIIKHYFILHIEMDEALSSAWWYGMVWCGLVYFYFIFCSFSSSCYFLFTSISFRFTFIFGSFIFLVYTLCTLFGFYLCEWMQLSFWNWTNRRQRHTHTHTHITTFMPEKWWTQSEWIWKSRKMHRISAPCRQYPKTKRKSWRYIKANDIRTYKCVSLYIYIYAYIETSIVH